MPTIEEKLQIIEQARTYLTGYFARKYNLTQLRNNVIETCGIKLSHTLKMKKEECIKKLVDEKLPFVFSEAESVGELYSDLLSDIQHNLLRRKTTFEYQVSMITKLTIDSDFDSTGYYIEEMYKSKYMHTYVQRFLRDFLGWMKVIVEQRGECPTLDESIQVMKQYYMTDADRVYTYEYSSVVRNAESYHILRCHREFLTRDLSSYIRTLEHHIRTENERLTHIENMYSLAASFLENPLPE